MIAILLADGFEEIEALTPLDILRRAGLDARTVAVGSKIAAGSHGIPVICDMTADEVNTSELTAVIFPGGMPGSLNLDAAPFSSVAIDAVNKNGGIIAAICAAPLVLGRRGLLNGKRAVCYPGFEKELVGATVPEGVGVVTDGNVITAKGMGAATDFALALVEKILGKEKADEIASTIMYERSSSLTVKSITKKEDEDTNSSDFKFPPIDLLKKGTFENEDDALMEINEYGNNLIDAFVQFGISASITGIDRGPRITRYILTPAKGVRIAQIKNVIEDVALYLGVDNIRMEAPVPGKCAVGIEIPNKHPSVVRLRDLIESDEFKNEPSKTLACLGKDIAGTPIFADVAKMPHVLVAGATGMGKSVCINSIIASILYRATPDEVRFILIDPKAVEFTEYNDVPHLLFPVITDTMAASNALAFIIDEMNRRYQLLADNDMRNLDSYNKLVRDNPSLGKPLPKIIIVIDELNDLMMQARNPIESQILCITQKARAAGIHMIIGTQRPTVDVITGVVKANIPSRISCKVCSATDSRTILDKVGAESLLDRGDMLFAPVGMPNPIRVQGAFISDGELAEITSFLKSTYGSNYDNEAYEKLTKAQKNTDSEEEACENAGYLTDKQFLDAVDLAISQGKISTSLIQRKISIGYGKAAKFIDIMEDLGIVSEPNGQKPRDVLVTKDEWEKMIKSADISSDIKKNQAYEPILFTAVSEDEGEDEDSKSYLTDKQFVEAVNVAISQGKISTSLIQRKISVGYGKAAKFIDVMEDLGIISEPDGQKPRNVLITKDEWDKMLGN